MHQVVRKVIKVARSCIGLGPILFQPSQLWQFHFRKDFPTHKVQQSMLRLIDFECFFSCSMVAPHDDVIRQTWRSRARNGIRKVSSNRHRQSAANYQWAGRIKCNACDVLGFGWWLHQGLANWCATATPNFLGALFEVPRFWLANRNVAAWTSQQLPSIVKYTSSNTASPNIYSNKEFAVRHDLAKISQRFLVWSQSDLVMRWKSSMTGYANNKITQPKHQPVTSRCRYLDEMRVSNYHDKQNHVTI